MYPEQQAAIFDPARYSLIEASTKAGKTVACLAWILEQASQGKPGWEYWWVAPWTGTARIAYNRLQRKLPASMRMTNETAMTITLRNGCIIRFQSGENPDGLYGEDVHAAVVDEASRVREEAWYALRSTITATNAPVRFIGNVKGRKNWFYKLARKAAAGEQGMAYHRLTWKEAVAANVLDLAEIESARRDLPEQIFKELYEAEPSDDEGNPFGVAAIGKCVGPLSNKEIVVFGWDLAKSVDWTVGIGLDEDRRTGLMHRFQQPWDETTEQIYQLTGITPALINSTGVGDPIVERLKKRNMRVEGFKFSSSSKQQLMESLATAIQHGEISFPDGVIRDELEAFEYSYTRTGVKYTAPQGMHDDAVCALGLAVWHHRSAISSRSTKAEVWSWD